MKDQTTMSVTDSLMLRVLIVALVVQMTWCGPDPGPDPGLDIESVGEKIIKKIGKNCPWIDQNDFCS